MRISDWSSDVCSSDLPVLRLGLLLAQRLGPVVEGGERLVEPLQAAAVEPQRRVAEVGEEGAVVADHQQGAAEALQLALQPVDGGQEIGRASCRERVCQYV